MNFSQCPKNTAQCWKIHGHPTPLQSRTFISLHLHKSFQTLVDQNPVRAMVGFVQPQSDQ